MCTAVSFLRKDHYFGRNLDLECSYGEEIVVTPRAFPLAFRAVPGLERHYAMLGVAHVAEGVPLYYDAVNEKGLGMAGLNFPGYAVYHGRREGVENVAPFELIPWVLGRCADLGQARDLLARTNLLNESFSTGLPNTPLHWMVADRTGALVVESMEDGLQVCGDPVGVLTNAPPFGHQLSHLKQFANAGSRPPESGFLERLGLQPDGRGAGALGLPGDWSSQSRFVRAAFLRANAQCGETEGEQVSQFFHILAGVEMARGSVVLADGQPELTRYSICYRTRQGVCYCRTYGGSGITAVDLHREDLDGRELARYPLREEWSARWEN